MNEEEVLDLINNIICEWERENKGKWFVVEFIKDLKLIKKEIRRERIKTFINI